MLVIDSHLTDQASTLLVLVIEDAKIRRKLLVVVLYAEKLGLGSSQLEKIALRAMEKIYGKTDGSELQTLR